MMNGKSEIEEQMAKIELREARRQQRSKATRQRGEGGEFVESSGKSRDWRLECHLSDENSKISTSFIGIGLGIDAREGD